MLSGVAQVEGGAAFGPVAPLFPLLDRREAVAMANAPNSAGWPLFLFAF